MLQSINFKATTSTVLFGVLLAADRIYLGEIGIGILKTISLFLVVGIIWWLLTFLH
jgi:TM2 domain-containing membrane protein YozV